MAIQNSPLTQERLKALLRYDQMTGLFFWRNGTQARSTPDGDGYIRITVDQKGYRAHRLAWLYMTGQWPRGQVDHKDTTRSNNKWENLRDATHGQNKQNSGARKNNKCGLKGVYLVRGRWETRIMCDGKRHYIGSFSTPEDAHAAYAEMAVALHGEFARAA